MPFADPLSSFPLLHLTDSPFLFINFSLCRLLPPSLFLLFRKIQALSKDWGDEPPTEAEEDFWERAQLNVSSNRCFQLVQFLLHQHVAPLQFVLHCTLTQD